MTAPIARRSAAAVQQEADNGTTDTDSRAQDPIATHVVKACFATQKGEKNKNRVGQNAVIGAFEVHKVKKTHSPR